MGVLLVARTPCSVVAQVASRSPFVSPALGWLAGCQRSPWLYVDGGWRRAVAVLKNGLCITTLCCRAGLLRPRSLPRVLAAALARGPVRVSLAAAVCGRSAVQFVHGGWCGGIRPATLFSRGADLRSESRASSLSAACPPPSPTRERCPRAERGKASDTRADPGAWIPGTPPGPERGQ